jgi:hypothetical protein
VRTVASILSNPRYTGRQVWNRHPQRRRRPTRFSPQDVIGFFREHHIALVYDQAARTLQADKS